MNELIATYPCAVRAPGIAEQDGGLPLRDEDMDRIIALIHRRAGIVLTRQKRGMIYGRLARLVRERGLASFREYLDLLEPRLESHLGEAFVNALTTNLTAFFRESHHFDLLAQHFSGRRGTARVWSCAASTGEEVYSIAMTLRQVLGDGADAQVLGTDVDTAALRRAEEGIYPLAEVLKHADSGIRSFFLRGQGEQAQLARVRPELAAMVQFTHLNLVAPGWRLPGGPFDAIFCRNVMIYFDKATQARLLQRFVPLLKPDGLLFAGHSENFSLLTSAFQLRGRTVYTLAQPPHRGAR